jgi:hypothetical protein
LGIEGLINLGWGNDEKIYFGFAVLGTRGALLVYRF